MPVTLPRASAPPPLAEARPPATARCANCGAAAERYCPRCGQETRDLHRSLGGILGELLDALAGWDGKIPATLWLLVRRPGTLTVDCLAGRRARHLRPLRLYLTMSVLFFVATSVVENPRARGISFSLESRLAEAAAGQASPASAGENNAELEVPSAPIAALAAIPQLSIPAYLFVAMRRVYGGSRPRTALKLAALVLTYGPIFLAATTLTAILAIFELAA